MPPDNYNHRVFSTTLTITIKVYFILVVPSLRDIVYACKIELMFLHYK